MLWNPTTDVLSVAWRSGEGVALDAASPAWTTSNATFASETMSTIGAVVIGEATNGSQNWSFGGRMYRIRILKNAVTLLDLRNTNITTVGQTTITPTTGPVMTFAPASLATSTMPKPTWAEGPTVYRHNMYWIVASSGEVDFIDSDLSGRYEVDVDDAVTVSNGDWIVGIDPLFGSLGHEEGANLTLSQMVFQYIPFSTETFVKAQIQEHVRDTLDPHSAAGYLKTVIANALYSPLVHTHEAEITGFIALHEAAADPHPVYLTEGEANGLYLKPGDILPYEPQGAVLAHEQKPDPHPQYVTHAEANQDYAVVDHLHNQYAQQGHTHSESFEVLATDGAQSARIYVGDDPPVNPRIGDLWIQTFDISLQAPPIPANLVVSATSPTTVTLSWNSWDPTVLQTGVQVERSPNGSTGWAQVFSDNTSPYATSFAEGGLAERTTYYYRVRGISAVGNGTWGQIAAATTNAPPGVPGGLYVNNQSTSNVRLNWNAVGSPANDPLHGSQPYEVFRNGTYIAATTNLYYDFGGLTENTGYNLGVRSKDNTGLTSALTQIYGQTANADPPTPTGLFQIGVNHYQFHMGWNAVGGIADFSRYQVFVNGGYWADTTATNYLFSGLGASSSYTFQVRSVDTGNAVSSLAGIGGTTSPNPDTTPPGPINFRSWQPRNNYGEMYFEFDSPGDAAYGEIFYNVNGSGWVPTYQGGLGGYHMHYNGTHGAGNTIYAAVNYRDANHNWYYSPHYAYTLVSSPSHFGAHSSNSWRPTNGGEWNANGGYKVVQGYYSNPALNSRGLWFYGTDFQNWWQGGRTLTAANIFINREGCGINQQDWITLYLHHMEASPGTTAFWGGAPDFGGGENIGTVQYNDAKWMAFNLGWAYSLCSGEYRGIGVANGGKPYVCLHPSSAGYSGVVELHHLG